MEVNVNKEQKLVEVWLTNKDQSDATVQCQLPPLFSKFKGLGYLIAVYHSGKDDLYRRTSDLLSYNRKRLAQVEIERERKLLN